MNNLYDNEEYKDIQFRMEKTLKGWMYKTEDPFDYGEREKDTNILISRKMSNIDYWFISRDDVFTHFSTARLF